MEPPELSEEELAALYQCLTDSLRDTRAAAPSDGSMIVMASWTQSDRAEARDYLDWKNFARVPYVSFTHGERFATNYANAIAAEAYGRYEDVDAVPAGGIIAKPTFSVSAGGEAMLATLFLMEKAAPGTSPDTNDWIYTSVMADGAVAHRTGGVNSDDAMFCAVCHMAMGEGQDDLIFLPEEYRVR